jgi:hypothetical protein
MVLKGPEHLFQHLGPVDGAVQAVSKAVSPHISKALGEKFDKGINRFQE